MAAEKKRVKKKEHEKLTDVNIARVIELLEDSKKPITKKEACEILNISYNTTRLNTIIENWKNDKETFFKRKQEKRGKPPTTGELSSIVSYFLSGDPINEIAKRVYRTPAFVKNIIDRIGVPERAVGSDKYAVSFLPEPCVSEDFTVGEMVWSAVYHRIAEVKGILSEKYEKLYGTKCYRIYVIENIEEPSPYFPFVEAGGFNAFSASYDIGKLTHLQELGVDLTRI